jgi:diamine N-acetyltransferase
MNIIYQTPQVADAEALSGLGNETFLATFGHLYSDKDLSRFLEKVFHR